jgi:succinylglutamate desuccinylase
MTVPLFQIKSTAYRVNVCGMLLIAAAVLTLPIAASFSPSMIKRVVVVGGTHGNEYTGVWCIKAIDRNLHMYEQKFPSLKISTLLANPEAHMANKRFIDTDLNREFTHDKLNQVGDDGLPNTIESLRAKEVDELLGPKFGGEDYSTDVVIDLHSTTANMGLTLIIPEGDVLMAQAAAYVVHKCGGEKEGVRCLMHSIPLRQKRANLSSSARHGFTIEVGPVPQGVLRHDAVENTDRALLAVLEFLEKRNQKRGDEEMLQELKRAYPSGSVPCFRSAPAKRPGELSGKIPWPSDPENPNFPAAMIHKSLQDRDFHQISVGDPLFVNLDGSITYYEGSHGDQVYLVFVNEGGYYYQSSGTGIGVAVKSEYSILDGMLTANKELFCAQETK